MSKSDDHVAKKDGIFFHPLDAIPDTFDVDDGIAEYVSSYLHSTISDDSFKAIMESTKNPYQLDYLTVVTLDTSSIQDLDWWIQKMKFNCTRKICTPQPNVLISTDSSDFTWMPFKSGQNSRLMERQ